MIEWADRVEACLPAEHLRVTLSVTSQTARRAILEARGSRYEQVLAALAAGAQGDTGCDSGSPRETGSDT